jgi:hypothetical protein
MQDGQTRPKLSADTVATTNALCAGYEEAAETGDRRGHVDDEDDLERPANDEAAVQESHLSADNDAVPTGDHAAKWMDEPARETAKQGKAAAGSVMSDEGLSSSAADDDHDATESDDDDDPTEREGPAVPDITESDDDEDLTGTDDRTESDDDDLTESTDPSSSSPDDSEDLTDSEGLTDAPEDLTDPEDTPATQRTVNRKRCTRSRKQHPGDPSTGHGRSQRHKYIWAERRSIRMTNLKVRRALRPKPASARDAPMLRRSIKCVQEMCTYMTHHDAVGVFNKLMVRWMLRDSDNACILVFMRGVLRRNPDLVWNTLTEHKSTALAVRKAALDPTVSLAMNTHPATVHTQAVVAPRLATVRQPRAPTEKIRALLSSQTAVMRRTCIALMAQCTATDGRPLYPISTRGCLGAASSIDNPGHPVQTDPEPGGDHQQLCTGKLHAVCTGASQQSRRGTGPCNSRSTAARHPRHSSPDALHGLQEASLCPDQQETALPSEHHGSGSAGTRRVYPVSLRQGQRFQSRMQQCGEGVNAPSVHKHLREDAHARTLARGHRGPHLRVLGPVLMHVPWRRGA